MKILIDEDGFLSIKRGNDFKLQKCPYDVKNNCGDWCPRFSENRLYIGICSGVLASAFNIEDRRQ